MGSGTCLHVSTFTAVSTTGTVPLPGVCGFLTNAYACGSPIAHFERSCLPTGWSCGTRA